MIYETGGGRSIEMSLEQYLDMSDEELKYIQVQGYGESIENPWHGSVLSKGVPIEEVDDWDIEDLTEIDIQEKLYDLDIDPNLREE